MFDSKQHFLQNGINLVSVKKDTGLFSIHLGIKVGSLFEEECNRGISHFIEHMLFKGTKNMNNEVLNNTLENIGGEYNAYTDHNCTVYSITALEEEFEKSVDILADMIKNSIFPKDEIEKERKVILSEIRTTKDDIEDISFRKINDVAYEKSSLKYDILGTEDHVKDFKGKDLEEFYMKWYIPNNCYISVVSRYDHEYVKGIIEKYLSVWEKKKLYKNDIIYEENRPGIFKSYKSDIEQNSIMYLFTFHNLNKKGELALKILNHRLGDSINSILFKELREKRGLVYDVYSNLDFTNGVKSLYLYTSVGKEKIEQTIEVINQCIYNIKQRRIIFDKDTVKLMKKVLKTAVVFTLEDPTDLSNYIIHQIIDGENIYGFIEDMKELDNVKNTDIYNVANEVLNKPTIHILINKN